MGREGESWKTAEGLLTVTTANCTQESRVQGPGHTLTSSLAIPFSLSLISKSRTEM